MPNPVSQHMHLEGQQGIEPLDFLASLSDKIEGFFYRCLNDKNYTMLRLTSGFDRMLGRSSADLVLGKRSFTDLVHPDDRAAMFQMIDRSLGLQERWRVGYRLQTIQGDYVKAFETGGGVYDQKSGKLLYLDGVILDMGRLG